MYVCTCYYGSSDSGVVSTGESVSRCWDFDSSMTLSKHSLLWLPIMGCSSLALLSIHSARVHSASHLVGPP